MRFTMSTLAASAIMLTAFLFLAPHAHAESAGKKIIPTTPPINLKPPGIDEDYIGFGLNTMTVTADWEDDFWDDNKVVGEKKYNATNLFIAHIESSSGDVTSETDYMVGPLTIEENTSRYYDSDIGRNVDIEADGSGFTAGIRWVRAKTFKKSENVDWNVATSIHALYYSVESDISAHSTDEQFVSEYTEWEYGFFFRPMVAVQPLVTVNDTITFIPFVGGTFMASLSYAEWEDTRWVYNGYENDTTDWWDDGIYFSFLGLEAIVGFDVGIVTDAQKKHTLTIGAALSQMLTGTDSNFSEAHVVYTIPF